jgi:GMP synthase (glutamine-hydrolysing)
MGESPATVGQASGGDFDKVLVVDLGAQYAQLIARRVREAHVFSEIVGRDITAQEIKAKNPVGIILSGGPASVYADDAYDIDPGILELGIPVLGICYGHQLIAHTLDGVVAGNDVAEYGRTELEADNQSLLLSDLPVTQQVWMSHRDAVSTPPSGFTVTASTSEVPVAAMENRARGLYGVQFHPEVAHTPHGQDVLKRFLYEACAARPTWTNVSIIEQSVAAIREAVGDKKVICGLSGGVD